MWPMHVNTHHFWGRRTCVPDGNCVDAIFYDWAWLSMDGVLTKVPLSGEDTGLNPTDQAKSGMKGGLLTEVEYSWVRGKKA